MTNNEMKAAVEEIKAEYEEKQTGKVEELKALHRKVKAPAEIFAYTFGSVGALVLGTGMSLAMKVIGSSMALGIGVGVIGLAMVSANYFFYNKILKSRKKKYRAEILAKSNEILNV